MSNSGQKKSKFKIQRRLGIELPGLGKPGALTKRNYPPGHHGQNRRRNLSEYGTRLFEKQKLKCHYGMREKQMKIFVKRAKKGLGQNWIEDFFTLLESRLDNLIFRLGFAPSMAAARQLILHKKVIINDRRVTIPSYIVSIGDAVGLVDKQYENTVFLQTHQSPRLPLPDYVEVSGGKKPVGRVVTKPTYEDIPFVLEKRFIAEYYSKTK